MKWRNRKNCQAKLIIFGISKGQLIFVPVTPTDLQLLLAAKLWY